ncbi:MAG: pentapeptide repeat-containing protein, partial [Methylocystis sp.]
VFGVYFLVWRTWIADRQRHVAQEQLYMGLLTKAIEQLGATRDETVDDGGVRTAANREVRLGAIYALEKLAADYLALHWQIMEVLCAYVRMNAGDPDPCAPEIQAIYAKRPAERSEVEHATLKMRAAELGPSVDVQAALTVVGRRSEAQKAHEHRSRRLTRPRRLDLSRCHLAGADLARLDFDGAVFTGSCLEGAILFRASLRDTLLDEAHLQGAKLESALLDDVLMFDSHLQGARLAGASLRFAHVGDSHLEGAHLVEADLEGARLHGAHLHGAALHNAVGLNDNDLGRAHGDHRTVIPDGLSRPAHWTAGDEAGKKNSAA